MENEREGLPEIEEKPYITDIYTSRKSGKKFRSPILKYSGGVLGVLGILGVISLLFSYVWTDRSMNRYLDFDDYRMQITIAGIIAVIGVLLYLFVDE